MRILFGKYRLLRPAGSGRTGTVWLAEHTGLGEYRAIKCVPKREVDYETFRREALILKELRHPGIPLVYDLEEDSEYFYLIEEYLEGYSLYTLIMDQGILQETEALRYGVQLCSLVEYMHSACEEPILHLDLQPNNLIVCGGTVRLVDFGCARERSRANSGEKRCGTRGCAAPEQYTSDQTIDERTDIYAIGAVLRFMVLGTRMPEEAGGPGLSRRLEEIIETCMNPDRERRYRSGTEAGEAMRALLAGQECPGRKTPLENRKNQEMMPSLHVVLTGSRPGAGTTHLAFGLCSYLAGRGRRVLYEEHNRSGAVRRLARQAGARPDRYGIVRVCGCSMKPWYGQAAQLKSAEGFEIILKDFGTAWREAARERRAWDGVLLAAAAENLWETGQVERMRKILTEEGEEEKLILVSCRGGRPGRPGQVLLSPEYRNPFTGHRKEQEFFDRIWEALSGARFPEHGGKRWYTRRRKRG